MKKKINQSTCSMIFFLVTACEWSCFEFVIENGGTIKRGAQTLRDKKIHFLVMSFFNIVVWSSSVQHFLAEIIAASSGSWWVVVSGGEW